MTNFLWMEYGSPSNTWFWCRTNSPKECVEAQSRSGHMNERMMEFIERQLKYDK